MMSFVLNMCGGLTIHYAFVVVHHFLDSIQIGGLYRTDRDVPHSTKLTTVIQMFVFQTKEVPNESSLRDKR